MIRRRVAGRVCSIGHHVCLKKVGSSALCSTANRRPSDRLRSMAKKKKNAPRKRKSAGKKAASKRSRQKEAIRTTRRSPLLSSLDVAATSGRRGFGGHSAG